ncbi:MAG: beta-ketoacyl-ACP synthase 3 [Bacteroidetes bacterium]|uniref:Beta-ketoacyl-ACP synthase 3 n=1 Tax=Candidatus Cryptobacteroides intestinigallinarum TaxID=2840767 RepID=A0A9D9HM86_9BACT|nr:beta-ketoacyl-ACP synthase 3 [Candidatus Cryptobacteroides intestinigallinarum]
MKIIGTGSAIPKKIVTNDMLSEFLDTSDAWIYPRTGIKYRHVISDEKLEDLAISAAQKALENAGITAQELDFIICSNVVNEYITPSLSCIIQGGIGATCPCLDINCACAGFIYALDIAETHYKAGKVKNVLIVCAEEPTRMTSWKDRNVCVLFGDGAGAAVLSEGDNIKGIKLSAASATDKLYQIRTLEPTPYITKEEQSVSLQMRGQDVFKFAVKASSGDIKYLLDELGMKADDIDHYLLHQANIRIIRSIEEFLGQPESKFPTNVESHGNSSSASCPILLDECNRNGLLKRGEKIAMSAFGAGFISGAAIMEW